MNIDKLQAELEQLFDLDGLLETTRRSLGLEPSELGNTQGLGAYVRALTTYCVDHGSIEALCDAVALLRPAASEELRAVPRIGLLETPLPLGTEFAGFSLERELGVGPSGISYAATRADATGRYRVKVLSHATHYDARGLQRFLTFNRFAADVTAAALPEGVTQLRHGAQAVIVHRLADGQNLAKLLEKTGPLRLEDAQRILRPVLDALRHLHERGLTHGNIKLENILVDGSLQEPRVVLLDAGYDRLRSRSPVGNRGETLSLSSPRTVAPEILRGAAPTPRSDLYSIGVVLFEILTGNAPFTATSSLDLALAHLTQLPGVPSDGAPKGAVSPEVDQLLLDLLSKQPEDRPRDARRLTEALDILVLRRSQRPPPPEVDVETSMEQLLENPTNEAAALALESLAASGADTRRIADCLKIAFEGLSADDPTARQAKIDLAFRAGRLFRASGELEQAESIYAALLAIQPHDRVARTALEDLLRDLQKFDELIEFWLDQAERAEAPAERAEFLSRIGSLYERELNDESQARLAHCQALCAYPEGAEHRQAVVRLAGNRSEAWAEVLEICGDAVQQLPTEERQPLLMIMGGWYTDRVNRLDLALQCYEAVLSADPTFAPALEGQVRIYRKTHNWADLAQLLLRRAEFAPSPAARRDLQVEAAEVLESRLGKIDQATGLYEQVLEEDPLHKEALEALRATYHRSQNHAAYARLLRKQLIGARGPERQSLLCRLAESHDQHLADPEGALQIYREVLAESVSNLEALRGMALIYARQNNNDELLKNLKQQFEFATTPKQKASLALGIADLLEKEFLDQQRAIESYEVVLALDPTNAHALTNLARMFRSQKRWAELSEISRRHIEASSDSGLLAQLWLSKAEAHYKLGEIPQAIAAYEAALQHKPGDADTLGLLANLQQLTGDASEALRSLDLLAETAATPEARVEHLLHAAAMHVERKDLAAAVERYQRALEMIPNHASASAELRKAYLVLGDAQRATQLLLSHIGATLPGPFRAKLTAELALLLLEHGNQPEQAEAAAREAIGWNEASVEALFVLGSSAYQTARYAEAAQHFSRLMHSLDSLSIERAVEATVRYIDTSSRLGAPELAIEPARRLQALAPDNPKALLSVAETLFASGQHAEAGPIFERLASQFARTFPSKKAAEIALRFADCVRLGGELERAMGLYEDAFDLNDRAPEPLTALAEVFAEREQWHEVWDVKRRLLDITQDEPRVELLLELAELAANKLGDRARAASSFVAALDARPGDRKILSRLMQIYTEERDWANTLDVVLKLADFVDDDQQKARYLLTAGMVSLREMNDPDTALDCYERALRLDPTLDKALDESAKILLEREDFEALEGLFKRKMKTATAARDPQKTLDAFLRLGHLYKVHMRRTEPGIDAYEAALTLDPSDRDAKEALFELYLTNPPKYFTKARDLQLALLHEEPYRAESYKALRRLYTELKNADGAWCLCQALAVLRLAEPDEERFYKRMRSDDPAYAQAVLSDEDYHRILHPEDLDPLLSELFAWIEPAVVASRGYEFFELGYDPNLAVDLARHAYPIGQTLYYAAGVMGMAAPPCFDNTNDPGGLAFLDTRPPAISMGLGVLTGEIHPQAIAFIAGRHLTFYRPGFFLRQLVGTGTGLKSWLFAAIKLISPQFPVTPDLEGPVAENAHTLSAALSPHARDALARVVSKLLQNGGALDMKKWVTAVDQTADRLGFLLCHDLETAVEVLRRSTDDAGDGTERRVRDLVRFSISPGYLELRQHLQISLST